MFKFDYVAYGLLAITAIIVIISVIEGLVRGVKKQSGTLGAVVLSAIIAALVTFFVCTPSSPLISALIDYLKGLLTAEQLQDIMGITEIGETLVYYATMVIAPFFFVAAFGILSAVLSIVWAIVYKIISPKKKGKKKKKLSAGQRFGGAGIGLACGLVVAVIALMPIVGVLDIATAAGEVIVSEANEEDLNVIEGIDIPEIVNDASENGIMKVYKKGTGWMFDSLASATFEGKRVYLKDDVAAVVSIVPYLSDFSFDIKAYDEKQVDAINGIVDGLDKSTMLKYTLSGIVSEGASKWNKGESFMGIGKISAGETLDPLLDSVIGVFATTTRETIGDDLRTVADIFGVLVNKDVLDVIEDEGALLNKLGKEGVIGDLIIAVNKNERMMVLSDEITKLSVRVLATTLKLPNDSKAIYNEVIGDIVSSINESANTSDRAGAISADLCDIFEAYGLEITAEQASIVAEALVADLGNVQELKNDHVEEFFVVHYGASPSENAELTGNGSYFEALAASSSITVNPDGTVTVGSRDLTTGVYTNSNYADSAAFKLGSSGKDIGDAKYLYSPELIGERSALVTLDMIFAHLRKYSECEDPDEEARKVSEMLSAAADIFTGSDFDNMSYDEIIAKAGGFLDKMSATEIFGKEAVNNIMTAILQTDSVKNELKLTAKEAGEFSDKLNNLVNENKTYADVTSTISGAINMMGAVKDPDISNEERLENTKNLIENMDKGTAEMLGSMINADYMIKYGAAEDNADTVADSVKGLFNNMADYNSEHDPEANQREADAVNKVLDLAVKGSEYEGSNGMFNDENGKGSLDTTAEDLVATIIGSDVVSTTIIDTANDGKENPYGITPGENDIEQLTAAMEDYYSENSVGKSEAELSELQERLNALAFITNIPAIDYTK